MDSLNTVPAGATVVGILALGLSLSFAGMETGQVFVHAVSGEVTFAKAGAVSQKLQPNTRLDCGTTIQTAAGATADLVLGYNRTVLRLTPNSALRVVKLDQMVAGGDRITETRLELISGAVAGVQRKLPATSYLEIKTPSNIARIIGTEYYVSTSGGVSVVSGQVSINYNLPNNGGSVKVSVPAGYSFDPATGTVVTTTPADLQNILAHVTAARNNAQTFKTGGATIVVKNENENFISTVHGNNGVGNGVDPQPPGNPPVNDGPGTGPGNPGNQGGNGHN
jgi:hypothetical protein